MSWYMRVMTVAFVILVMASFVQAGGRADTVRTVFMVEGMHCDGCSSTITATLERHEGVLEASADHEKGVAEAVHHPRQVQAEELKAEIEKLGYTVTGMSTEAVDS